MLSIGSAVRLVTNGLVLATYRPEDVRDEVDIAVRVPNNWRELDQLQRQTINTPRGQVPLSQFVTRQPICSTVPWTAFSWQPPWSRIKMGSDEDFHQTPKCA